MRILHYTLGFPPKRSGGLVKYVTDLMKEQKRQGHEVSALYPGRVNLLNKRIVIRENEMHEFGTFEIMNSLPLPLFGGIKEPYDFMMPAQKEVYSNFLRLIEPSIIHVHTLMGIHREFFEAAKEMGIPVLFTSHDYFGLAPEPNFYFADKSYDQDNTICNWIRASEFAMSSRKLRLFQLKIYPTLRKILRRLPKREIVAHSESPVDFNEKFIRYEQLKLYYQSIFKMIDMFHFNSSLAKEVFVDNIDGEIVYRIVTITNSEIRRRDVRKIESRKIRIAYIGPNKRFKGFYDFIKLAEIMGNQQEYEFHTYGYNANKNMKEIIQHGVYSVDDLEDIYKNIDILVVPSQWKETFGLVVLEALSMNTRVFCSTNTGAGMLLSDDYLFGDIEELKDKIISIKNKYNTVSRVKDMATHQKEVITLYNELERKCNEA